MKTMTTIISQAVRIDISLSMMIIIITMTVSLLHKFLILNPYWIAIITAMVHQQ